LPSLRSHCEGRRAYRSSVSKQWKKSVTKIGEMGNIFGKVKNEDSRAW
jgi:hypothetical protein